MLTQPPVWYSAGFQTFPLPENLWQFFCHKADAEALLAKVKIVVTDVVVEDGTRFLAMPAQSTDPDVKIWLISGSYNGAPVKEFAGALFDRMTHPNVWVDKNVDSTIGGSTLHVQQYGDSYTELSWRK